MSVRFKGPQYSMPRGVYDKQQAYLPKSSLAWFDESIEGPNTLVQAGQYETLGRIPLIVLASAQPSSLTSKVEDRDLQDTWLELQQEITLLSEIGEIKMLEDSGHYIQFDQPELVIKAIQSAVQQCLPVKVP